MKKFFAVFIALIICAATSTTLAASPTCVMLTFSNDTRYKNIDSAAVLSDLVMEKLLNSGKFNFTETKVIDADMEDMLYEERALEFKQAAQAANSGNYSVLFEGSGFNAQKAQTIATAQVGQFVSPAITSAIGKQHDAEYLIQGTIVNIGQGDFSDNVHLPRSYGSGRGSFYFYSKEAAVGVAVALRVIKAETGEVVWCKDVSAQKKTSLVQIGMFMVGTAKISSGMYSKMMDRAAQKISDAMIEDLTAGKLFAK